MMSPQFVFPFSLESLYKVLCPLHYENLPLTPMNSTPATGLINISQSGCLIRSLFNTARTQLLYSPQTFVPSMFFPHHCSYKFLAKTLVTSVISLSPHKSLEEMYVCTSFKYNHYSALPLSPPWSFPK